MAGTIPEVNSTPDVSEQPLPAAYNQNRTNPETFGYGLGQQSERAGAEAERLAVETQTRFNAAAAEGAYGRAQKAYNDIIADPQNGYLSLKGDDAIKQGDEYKRKFTAAVGAIRAQLSPAQERDIGYRLDQHVLQPGLLQVASHERREHDVIADAQFKGSELAATDNIETIAGNPAATVEQMNDATSALVANAHSRAVYKYGANPSNDAVKLEALPLMHKAAVTAMSAAMATGDPQHAANTLMVFGEHLGPAAKMYTGAVNKMLAAHTVAASGEQVLAPATIPVALPDGTMTSRLDEGKVNAGLTKLYAEPKLSAANMELTPEETKREQATHDAWVANKPHQADILKYVEQQQQRLDTAWKKTVAQQVDSAMKQGDPLATGQFDMDKVQPATRAWLQQNSEKDLVALGALQNKEDARARAADRADSLEKRREDRLASEEIHSTVGAQIVDKDHREKLLNTSPEEFQSMLLKGQDLDGDPLPAKLIQKDLSSLVKNFRQAQKDAGANQLDEKPAALVAARIQLAASFDPFTTADLTKRYSKVLKENAEKFIAANKGTVTQEKVEEYIDHELANGAVVGAGRFWGDSSDMPLVEAQANPEYKGKTFKTSAGDYSEVLGGGPPRLQQAQPGPTVKAASVAPNANDTAALEWLRDPKNAASPAAVGVKAKLKAKGLVP